MDQLRYYTEDINSLIGCLHVISTSKLGKITCSCYMLDCWLLNDVQWWLSMFSKDASANFGTLRASIVPIISTPESLPFISRTSLMFFGRARFELRMILRKRIHAYKPMITNLLTVITGAQTYTKLSLYLLNGTELVEEKWNFHVQMLIIMSLRIKACAMMLLPYIPVLRLNAVFTIEINLLI